jgi:hypothetical protein
LCRFFFKNFMDARVEYIILPVAKAMLLPEQAAGERRRLSGHHVGP